jgi:hypothetical protein
MERADERGSLVAALRAHGIRFLAGGDGESELTPPELSAALAKHPDPRLHLALTAVFLLHPEWAAWVPEVVRQLDAAAAVELQARYMAAVYLQRLWRTRLRYYVRDFKLLPDLYSQELGLPPSDERYGKVGLVALAEWHAQYSAYPFNRLASYYKAADLLLGQLRAEANEFAPTG